MGSTIAEIATLRDSADVLDDHEELNRRWNADGYLFLRGVLDTDAVERLRRAYMNWLHEQGLVTSVDGESVWTGEPVKGSRAIEYEDLGEAWRALANDPATERTLRAVLGESPSWLPIVSYRAALPSETTPDDPFVARHQDGFYNPGLDLRICWIPLMPIPADLGGLAVAEAHHSGVLHDGQSQAIPAEKVAEESWRRIDYLPGDVLIFNKFTPHSGLANTSDRIRLSIDIRVLNTAAPKPVIGAVESIDDSSVTIHDEDGADVTLAIDDGTYIRGLGAVQSRSARAHFTTGDRVLAATDADRTRAVLVRTAT
ncbi:phytanoyl-CoA dioxygenase family protein [Streptomyces sp. NPDC090075]|uniref:phytanoyl-CoA dioxygenase family protein n=1 Tax=Streptomyces sp. NPDC090075 TaxID=3365937 RepID=UPI0038155FBC